MRNFSRTRSASRRTTSRFLFASSFKLGNGAIFASTIAARRPWYARSRGGRTARLAGSICRLVGLNDYCWIIWRIGYRGDTIWRPFPPLNFRPGGFVTDYEQRRIILKRPTA